MRPLAALAAALLVAALTPTARGATTVTFPYQDAKLLAPGEKNGGLAYLAKGVEGADEPVPVVVFLHGLNDRGLVHFWYGLQNYDLRPLVDDIVATGKVRPFVLAAPSQTVRATALSTIWTDFDLDTFLDATEAALPAGVAIDRDAIVVVGHSGAGCNPSGGLLGLFSPFVAAKPIGVVAADVCYDASTGATLGAMPVGTQVVAYYQPFTWWRDLDQFRAAFDKQIDREPGRMGSIVIEQKNSADPHNVILERALRETLPALLPIEAPDPYP